MCWPADIHTTYVPCQEKNLLLPYANNKATDQPAHVRSLIGAFSVRCLGNIISLVSISDISRLWLASVAAKSTLVANPEDWCFL